MHFIICFYSCKHSICTSVNNDYVHFYVESDSCEPSDQFQCPVNAMRCSTDEPSQPASQQCRAHSRNRNNNNNKNALCRLNCHFPFRILIFKRERAHSLKTQPGFAIDNAKRKKRGNFFGVFFFSFFFFFILSFYCFKIQHSFQKAINAD